MSNRALWTIAIIGLVVGGWMVFVLPPPWHMAGMGPLLIGGVALEKTRLERLR